QLGFLAGLCCSPRRPTMLGGLDHKLAKFPHQLGLCRDSVQETRKLIVQFFDGVARARFAFDVAAVVVRIALRTPAREAAGKITQALLATNQSPQREFRPLFLMRDGTVALGDNLLDSGELLSAHHRDMPSLVLLARPRINQS